MRRNFMARRRRYHPRSSLQYQPLYQWALDADGQPIHILEAGRSVTYFCPVCGGKMIAKLGDIKQHHFAHETQQYCEPEAVAQAAASRWIANHIQACLREGRGIVVTWPCPMCHQPHTVDLLEGITQVRQKFTYHELELDVALLDAQNVVHVALLFSTPSPDTLAAYVREKIMVIVIDAVRGHFSDMAALLAGAQIYGGICTTQQNAAQRGVIADPAALRAALTDFVARPPYQIHGPLETYENLTHVFTWGEKKLWLPPILWQRAVGGLLHTINPALHVISQEWPQPDGSTIALYYVTARATHAIAVRRFLPGQPVYARLDSAAFRSDRLSAANIARSFAEL
jgi:hypothetical protein